MSDTVVKTNVAIRFNFLLALKVRRKDGFYARKIYKLQPPQNILAQTRK